MRATLPATSSTVARMEIALAGAGNISVVHAMAAVATGSRVTAVASRSERRARERAEQTEARLVAMAELPAGADAVVVATPPAAHAAIAQHALDAGAVVLIETPLTTTLSDADALVDADDGRILYGENLAFSPAVRRAVGLARELGALRYIEVRALSPRPTDPEHLDPAWGGGAMFDLGSHPIALALFLAGDDSPTSVSAEIHDGERLELDDHGTITITFASGLHARVEASWRSETSVWDLQASSDSGVVRAELLPNLSVEHDGEPVTLPPMRSDLDPRLAHLGFLEEHRALTQLANGEPRGIDANFGRRVLDIVCASYASAGRDGAPVDLPFGGPRDRTPHQLRRGDG